MNKSDVTPSSMGEARSFAPSAMAYANISYRVLGELRAAHDKFPDQHLPWGGGTLTFPEAVPTVARDIMRGRCDLKLAENTATWCDVIAEEFFEANAEHYKPQAVRELVQLAAMCFRAIADIESEEERRQSVNSRPVRTAQSADLPTPAYEAHPTQLPGPTWPLPGTWQGQHKPTTPPG